MSSLPALPGKEGNILQVLQPLKLLPVAWEITQIFLPSFILHNWRWALCSYHRYLFLMELQPLHV